MVSNATLTSMMIEMVLSIGVPLIAIVYLLAKKKITWKPILIGMLIFMVSQIFFRLPLLQWLSTIPTYQSLMSNVLFSALFLGLTAGIFEEIGRYLGFSWMPKRRHFWDAIGYGLGHGGIESILIVGVSTINNYMVALAINNGTIQSMVEGVDPTLVQEMITLLTTTPSWMFLLGGVERLCTLAIHIALSLVVLKAIKTKDWKQVGMAILLHTVVNTPVGLLAPFGVVVTELYIVGCAAVAIWYIVKEYRMQTDSAEERTI